MTLTITWNTAKYPRASARAIIFHFERSFRSDSVIHFPCSGKMKSCVSAVFAFAGATSFAFFTDLESCDGRWLFFVFSSDFVDAFILVSYWKLKRYLSIPSFSPKSKKIWNSPLFPLYILIILFYICSKVDPHQYRYTDNFSQLFFLVLPLLIYWFQNRDKE